jgi:hypothetical protein
LIEQKVTKGTKKGGSPSSFASVKVWLGIKPQGNGLSAGLGCSMKASTLTKEAIC